MLQAIHAVWSVGGTLGPLVLKLFLVEISDLQNINTHQNLSSHEINRNESLSLLQYDLPESTRYAFVTMGIVMMIPAAAFFIVFCQKNKFTNKVMLLSGKGEQSVANIGQPEVLVARYKVTIFFALIFLFSFLNLYLENLPICYIVFFALKHLHWSVLNSSRLLSIFFAFHFTGRMVAVVASVWVGAGTMLAVNLTVTLMAYVSMLFVDYWQPLVWISVAVAGFGVSTTFPCSLLWVSEYVTVDGKLGSLFIVASSLACISGPFFVSVLTSHCGPFAYVYLLLGVSSLHCVVFLLQWAFSSHVPTKNRN